MKFAEADDTGGNLVEGYRPGAIQIAGRTYREGLIVTARHISPGWGPTAATNLAAEHVEALVAFRPQVIVLGTGRVQVFPHPTVYAAAYAQGIGIEIMDTGAACRTFNILVGEGRDVVAGLLML